MFKFGLHIFFYLIGHLFVDTQHNTIYNYLVSDNVEELVKTDENQNKF